MAHHHRDQTQRSFARRPAVTPPGACPQALGKYNGTPLIGCERGPHSPPVGSVPCGFTRAPQLPIDAAGPPVSKAAQAFSATTFCPARLESARPPPGGPLQPGSRWCRIHHLERPPVRATGGALDQRVFCPHPTANAARSPSPSCRQPLRYVRAEPARSPRRLLTPAPVPQHLPRHSHRHHGGQREGRVPHV